MANLPQQDTIVQYLADGITTNYVVPFYTTLEPDGTPDLDVYTQLNTATPVPAADIKTWNVDYIYTPNSNPTTGGMITFLTGHVPPNGYAVTIVRDVQASLDAEFSDARNFSGITLDAVLDKLLLISQQNKSYALDRNLSYIVNSYIPSVQLSANVQVPVLQAGQVWLGSSGGVIAATLNQSGDTSTLRSELASNAPVTDGATLVGYYDSVNVNATTVAAQLNYLTASVVAPFPTGTIIDFGGSSAPSGFLACDGSAVSRATYADLFAVIGVLWGIGDGSTTFNLPNLVDNITAGSGGALFSSGAVGTAGGATTYQLAANDLPAHVHAFSYSYPTTASYNILAGATGVAGVTAHQNSANTQANGTTNTPISLVQLTKLTLKCIKT